MREGEQMTDRELLERAAKAAGVEIGYWAQPDYPIVMDGNSTVGWNPLKFDSDALRLAVKLRIDIDWDDEHVECYVKTHDLDIDGLGPYCASERDADWGAAVRRAIVRAAAAMAERA